MANNTDLRTECHGSIYLLRPLTDAGREWIEENINLEEAQTWGGAVVVEHRYIWDIVAGAEMAGLLVQAL